MANPLRGEASFKAGDVDMTLTVNVNVLCEVEEQTGLGINDLVAEIQASPKLTLVRSFFCAALQPKHPGTTIVQTGEIMADAGMETITEALQRAIMQAMPPPKKAGLENPPKRRRGAGTG